MLGFVNGLALVMTRSQLVHFKVAATGAWLSGPAATVMYGLTALTMVLVKVRSSSSSSFPPRHRVKVISLISHLSLRHESSFITTSFITTSFITTGRAVGIYLPPETV